jgi:hypothetical protein
MRTLVICLFPMLLTAGLSAQTVAGSFSPNPVAPGVPVTFTGTDASGHGVNLPSPCGWYRIHQGSQTGPIVNLGIFCIQVIVPIAANGTFSFTWDQRDATAQLVPPGTYWFETRVWDSGFTTLSIDWFCLSIQPAGVPALTASGPARLGLSTPLQVTAPTEPGALWIVAASLSSNNPIFPGACLSDPIFFEPFTAPIGVLDGSGLSSGLALLVPSSPVALYQGIHVQSLIFGASSLLLTNDVSFTVQP